MGTGTSWRTRWPALAPQVDELARDRNVPGSLPQQLPEGVRVLENETPLSFAANAKPRRGSTPSTSSC